MTLAALLLIEQWDLTRAVTAATIAGEFGTLMVAISFVGLAANRSAIGPLLKRFFTRTSGRSGLAKAYCFGHGVGVLLNLPGLVVLASAMKPDMKDGSSKVLVTLHRGFALAPAWSPYSYFTPIVLTTMPGVRWGDLVIISGCFVLPLLLLSLRVDRASSTKAELVHVQAPISGKEKRALLLALSFCSAMVLSINFSGLSPRLLIHWLLPTLAFIWAALEYQSEDTLVESTKNHLFNRIPMLRFEILALFAAGFLSTALLGFEVSLPIEAFSRLLGDGFAQNWIVSAAALTLFTAMIGLMMVGVNPILFVGLVSGAVAAGTFTLTTGLTILIGVWGAFPTLSPFAAANLVVARSVGITGQELSFGPNRYYNLAMIAVGAVLVVLSTQIEYL